MKGQIVITGLDPVIHATGWPGCGKAEGADGRIKSGHDELDGAAPSRGAENSGSERR